MKAIIDIFKRKTVLFGIFAVLLVGVVLQYQSGETSETSYAVVSKVEIGEVTSGIRTTGEIVAAQKLDLDVYKQLSRIDVVNVSNGSEVKAGDILISFDKSDALVDIASAEVNVAEKNLALDTEQKLSTNPNADIQTLENNILVYEKTITDAEQDKEDAWLDYLNADIAIEPATGDEDRLLKKSRPTISGRYVGTKTGSYTIDIYGSGAESGYSFRVTGLESMTGSIFFNQKIDIGSLGLEITFPNDIRSGDTWVIDIPNSELAVNQENKKEYDTTISNLNEKIVTARANIESAKAQLTEKQENDSLAYRSLNVDKASKELLEARQSLREKYDVVQDRDIIAPFDGTIQDMQNVVAGATPVGGTEDPINLGMLVSNQFQTTFTLGAVDVATVGVGQRVDVVITSLQEQPKFTAIIAEISTLPETEGVAQYKVTANIEYNKASSSVTLREGLLANIEIVGESNENAVRVPRSAVTFENQTHSVNVIDTLTPEQQSELETTGVLSSVISDFTTRPVVVEVGIQGQYFTEIRSGLTEGMYVVSNQTAPDTSSVVVQPEFGPPGSGNNGGPGGPGGGPSQN